MWVLKSNTFPSSTFVPSHDLFLVALAYSNVSFDILPHQQPWLNFQVCTVGMQSSLSLANCEPLDISSARPPKCVAAVSEIFGSGLGCGFPWEDSFRMQDPAGFALLKASPNVFGAIQTSCKERSPNIKFISGQWIIDWLLRIWGGFRTLSNCRRRIQSNVWSIRKLQSTNVQDSCWEIWLYDHVQTSSITFC